MNSNNNSGFDPNRNNNSGFNPNEQYNDTQNQQPTNPNRTNYNDVFNARVGQVVDFINNQADNFQQRAQNRQQNNPTQNTNYYNDQPINNIFADDPNEELAKKTFALGLIALVLSLLGIIVFWVSLAKESSFFTVVSMILTIAGFVSGIISVVTSSKYNKLSKNMELTNSVNKKKNSSGMAMAIVAIVFSGLSIVSCMACVGCLGCLGCIGMSS